MQPSLPSGWHIEDIKAPLPLLIRTVLPCHICKHTKTHAPTAITGWDSPDPNSNLQPRDLTLREFLKPRPPHLLTSSPGLFFTSALTLVLLHSLHVSQHRHMWLWALEPRWCLSLGFTHSSLYSCCHHGHTGLLDPWFDSTCWHSGPS